MEASENAGSEIYLHESLAKHFPELKSMVALVTCPICYDVVKDPLTTTVDRCGHTFCSICVRGYLTKYKQQCPECLVELHDKDLLVNRPLKSMAQYLQSLIPKVQDMVKVSKTTEHDSMQDSGQDIVNNISASHSTNKLLEETNLEKDRIANHQFQEAITQVVAHESLPMITNFTITDTESSSTPSTSLLVSCPVCQLNIPERNVNLHLDKCLSQTCGKEESKATTNSAFDGTGDHANQPREKFTSIVLSPVANQLFSDPNIKQTHEPNKNISHRPSKIKKVVYYLLKESDLKKLLRNEGLEVKGDRKTLIDRHQRFSVLWNSQCDAENPMTRAQIINQLKREEQNLTAAASSTSSPSTSMLLHYDRNSHPKIIESKQKAYLEKNKSQFGQLIQQLKERKMTGLIEHKDSERRTTGKDIDELTDTDDASKVPGPFENRRLQGDDSGDGSDNEADALLNFYSTKNQVQKKVSQFIDKTNTIDDDIKPVNETLQPRTQHVVEKPIDCKQQVIFPPMSSSTPKAKRSCTVVSSNTKDPINLMNEDTETCKRESDEVEDEANDILEDTPPPAKRQKNKLSLSRRYAAGSSKKSPCPVCQLLVRDSIINFHLDHCLGKQEMGSSDSVKIHSPRKTRSVNKLEKDNATNDGKEDTGGSDKEKNSIGSGTARNQGIRNCDAETIHLARNMCIDKRTDDMVHTKKEDIGADKEKYNIVPKLARKHSLIFDADKRSSADLFNDYSDDGFNFPLSQLHDKNCKSVVTKQASTSSISSDVIKLLNVTPDIIETDEDTQLINFSELIEENLQGASMHCGKERDPNCPSTSLQNTIIAKPTDTPSGQSPLGASDDLKISKEKSRTKADSKRTVNKKNKVDESLDRRVRGKKCNSSVIAEEVGAKAQSENENIVTSGASTRRTRASKASQSKPAAT